MKAKLFAFWGFSLVLLTAGISSGGKVEKRDFASQASPANYSPELWRGAETHPNNWLHTDWFGWFREFDGDWIYHFEHGWEYPVGRTASDFWLHDPQMNSWLWNSDAAYAYLYKKGLGEGWYEYKKGCRPGKRLFRKVGHSYWMAESALKSSGEPPPDPVEVASAIDPTVATDRFVSTAFLYSGDDPVQTGMSPDTIDPIRVAVVRGQVLDANNNPLQGVRITVLDHPEYGQTLSREADGMFDLALNGGGILTLNYEKHGFLPVQRDVQVPWQDFGYAPDVIMIPLDENVTKITLSDSAIQIHQGSEETDSDGPRRATMLFMPETTAELVMPDGRTMPLDSLNIRATEYTVGTNGPKAMPAELPPNTAYTYAVELSADEAIAAGASQVTFNQPIYTYVENFIGAPVGTAVPTGYYDPAKAQWLASENGRVIQIVDISNGLALLDIDGDGAADSGEPLAELGITNEERATVATLYQSGAELWRVPIEHLTSWDCNWPYGPPEDAAGPNGDNPNSRKNGGKPEDNPCTGDGSIIECQNQILGQRIGITGTPYTLNYRSNLAEASKAAYSIEVPISGETLPASLQNIILEIHLAGRFSKKVFPSEPNQVFLFTWDGLDAYRRVMAGPQPIEIKITFQYPATYYPVTSEVNEAFDRVQGSSGSGSGGTTGSMGFYPRQDTMQVDIERVWKGEIGGWQNLLSTQCGGWTFDVHHAYAPLSRDLFKGDGSRRNVSGQDADMIITRVAGGGESIAFDGSELAVNSKLESPQNIALGPDGSLYICDTYWHCVFKVTPDGYITRAAGQLHKKGFWGDGGPATDAMLYNPMGVAVGRDGSIYIADTINFRIRKVDPDGIISTIAGTGEQAFHGDGGPATQAALRNPTDLAFGPDKCLYIADSGNRRIRKITGGGTITTVAGDGSSTSGRDGRLAVECGIEVKGMDVGSDGSVYIANSMRKWVRKVNTDGTLVTVAGNASYPSYGFGGDGGPALEALLNGPSDVVCAGGEAFYIADQDNNRIRKVDGSADHIITTIAGNDIDLNRGDNGPASAASFGIPGGIAIDPDGRLYAVDRGVPKTVRRIEPFFSGVSVNDILIASKDGQLLYQFTATGKHLRTLDALTGDTIYAFSYDAGGRLIEIIDSNGLVTVIERNTSGKVTAIVAPYGDRTVVETDTNGYLSKLTNPAGSFHGMQYTEDGLMTRFTDPEGNRSSYEYDAIGLLVASVNPSGGRQTFSRSGDETGYTVTKTSPSGLVTTFRMEDLPTGERISRKDFPDGTWNSSIYYPDGGQVTTYCDGTVVTIQHGPDPRFGMQSPIVESLTIQSPDGVISQLQQWREVELSNPADRLSLVKLTDYVDVDGRLFTYEYDPEARTITETRPTGLSRTTTMDEAGNIARIDLGEGLDPILFSHDELGRLTRVAHGGQSWDYTHEGANIVTRTDAAGNDMHFSHDALNRLTGYELAKGEKVGQSFDGDGHLQELIMPSGARHSLNHNARGLLASYTPPGGLATSFHYNGDAALTEQRLPNGKSIDNLYDESGRWTDISYPEASVELTQGAGCGSLEGIEWMATGSDLSQDIDYLYDGKLLTQASFSGHANGVFDFQYGAGFYLNKVTLTSGSDTWQADITRNEDGLVITYGPFTLTRGGPDGTVSIITDSVAEISIQHDGLGRVSGRSLAVNGIPVHSYSLQRNNTGAIRSILETRDESTVTKTYTYDANLQLLQVGENGPARENFGYDANGNRTLADGAVASYDQRDRLLSRGDTVYQFDAAGFMTSRGPDTFVYTARGELMSANLEDETHIHYVSDGYRRRVGRISGTEEWQFLFGDPYDPFLVTAARSPNNQLLVFYHDEQGFLYAFERAGIRYYVATDPVGSPVLVVDAAGTIVKERRYSAFGTLLSDSNPEFDLPIGYAGGLEDPVTGLIRFGLRDYDPEAGRWTATDPILFEGSPVNLYAYVQNNPISLRDPMGLWCIGASGYAGVGAGAELCCSNGKCSICGEIGLGLGVSGTLGDGGAKHTGSESVAEASAQCGPIGGAVKCGYRYKCGADCNAEASLGPYKLDTSGESKVGLGGGAEKALSARCSAQAKISGVFCKRF